MFLYNVFLLDEFIFTTDSIEFVGPKIKLQDNKFCISLYAAMCSKCTLIIYALPIIETTTSKIFKETVKIVNVNTSIYLDI